MAFSRSSGVEVQRRKFYREQILKVQPERKNDSSLYYGDVEHQYLQLVNDGTIKPNVDVSNLKASTLLSRLQENSTAPAPSGNVPTITTGSAYTVTEGYYTALPGDLITEVGSRGIFNNSNSYLTVVGYGHIPGLDFYLNGDTVEIGLNAQTASTPIWIFVDGQPTTTAPVNQITVNNTLYTMKLTFPSVARRRIEIFGYYVRGWYGARATYANLISPSPRKPVVCFVGDSYYAGSDASSPFESAPFFMSRLLGVECANASFGGTGYVTAGSFNMFGSTERQTLVKNFNPELILIQGTVNDTGKAGIGDAAAATYKAFATVAPDVPIIVFGAQPTNAETTISANTSANIAAVKAAAEAAPNVIAFYDMIGTAGGLPPVWASTGQTYNLGDRTIHNGAVYEWRSTVAGNVSSPGTSGKWGLVSYALTGTGRVGAVAGNGTRDTYLYTDNVHPTAPANVALGLRQIEAIKKSLSIKSDT